MMRPDAQTDADVKRRQVVALLVELGAVPPRHTGDVLLNLNQGGLTRVETTIIWK